MNAGIIYRAVRDSAGFILLLLQLISAVYYSIQIEADSVTLAVNILIALVSTAVFFIPIMLYRQYYKEK
jgi:uncharacterized membrane-anchored protein